jgi:hypothetical protein
MKTVRWPRSAASAVSAGRCRDMGKGTARRKCPFGEQNAVSKYEIPRMDYNSLGLENVTEVRLEAL